jgi:uncharacterized protein (TIRG00374 family)
MSTTNDGPGPDVAESTSAPGSRLQRLAWLPGFVLLVLVIVVIVTHFSEEKRFAALLTGAEPVWLVAAVALQAATYLCAGGVWSLVLSHAGIRLPLTRLARLALVKLAVDQLVPTAGISGTVIVSRRLGAAGVAPATVATAVLVSLFAYFGAYLIAVLVALALLWAYHDLNAAVLGLAFAFSLVACGIAVGIWWLGRARDWRLPGWLQRQKGVRLVLERSPHELRNALRDWRLIGLCVALDLAIFVLDAGTLLTMLRAVSEPAGPAAAFASFTIASVAGTMGFLPGGLGTFEATEVAVLALFGTGVEAALTATLLLRGFTFWIPMVIGTIVARRPAFSSSRD